MKKILFLFLFSTHFFSVGMHLHFDTLPAHYAIVSRPDQPGTWVIAVDPKDNPHVGQAITVCVWCSEHESYDIQANIIVLGQNPQPTE